MFFINTKRGKKTNITSIIMKYLRGSHPLLVSIFKNNYKQFNLIIMNSISNLTDSQKNLLSKIKLYKYVKNSDGIFLYDDMKAICDFKTFDSTFNALLNKGCVKRVQSNDFTNKFKLNF